MEKIIKGLWLVCSGVGFYIFLTLLKQSFFIIIKYINAAVGTYCAMLAANLFIFSMRPQGEMKFCA